jgi:hypothetical protein
MLNRRQKSPLTGRAEGSRKESPKISNDHNDEKRPLNIATAPSSVSSTGTRDGPRGARSNHNNNINLLKRRRISQSKLLGLLGVTALFLVLLFLYLRPYSSPPYVKPKTPYPSDMRISVVLMNHNRPRMIHESQLLPTLLAHKAVQEVLLCHSSPRTAFVYNHSKVTNINAVAANAEHGLSLRFHYCRQAQHSVVLHVDDDMELSTQALDDLLSEFASHPHRIVGKYGRSYSYWRNVQRAGYDTASLGGPVEVVLTKILMLERDVCEQFFRYSPLVQDMVQAESSPLWNGEDIFVNLVANHYYQVPANGPYNNFAIKDLDVWEASDEFKDDDTGEHDVSGNMDRHRPWNVGWSAWWKAYRKSQRHAAYRGRFWYTAKQRLAEL